MVCMITGEHQALWLGDSQMGMCTNCGAILTVVTVSAAVAAAVWEEAVREKVPA